MAQAVALWLFLTGNFLSYGKFLSSFSQFCLKLWAEHGCVDCSWRLERSVGSSEREIEGKS